MVGTVLKGHLITSLRQKITSPTIAAKASANKAVARIVRASRSRCQSCRRRNKIFPSQFVIMVFFWFSPNGAGMDAGVRSGVLPSLRWQLPTMGWESEGNGGKNVRRRRTPASRNRPEERRRVRGRFPRPEAPRIFAGNQTGKAAASGSDPVEQRRTGGWLDFAGRTF